MKKKLLALLLAAMMVVALVPTFAISAVAADAATETLGSTFTGNGMSAGNTLAPLGATQQDATTQNEGGAQAPTEPIPDDPEALAEVLNGKNERVAYANTLDELAALVGNGYTVRLQKDVTLEAALVISTPGAAWTLDGAGHTLTLGANTLTFTGEMLDLLVTNLTVTAAGEAITVGDASKTTCKVTLNDVKIYAGGATIDADGSSAGSAVVVNDMGFVCVTGENTALVAGASPAVVNYGHLDVQAGFVYAGAAEAVVLTSGASGNTGNTIAHATSMIFGGEFVAGSGCSSLFAVNLGATLSLEEGTFRFNSTLTGADVNLLRVSDASSAGLAFISGGTFYNNTANAVVGFGNAEYAYLRLYGATVYTNVEEDLAPTSKTTTFAHPAIVPDRNTTPFGIVMDEIYMLTVESDEAGYVFEDVTYTYKAVIDYNEESELLQGESRSIEVTNGSAVKKFYACELERALHAVADGGVFKLLEDADYTPLPANNGTDVLTAYAVSTLMRHTQFAMNMTGRSTRDPELLTGNSTEKYLIWFCSGVITINNLAINNTTGRAVELNETEGYEVELILNTKAYISAQSGSAVFVSNGTLTVGKDGALGLDPKGNIIGGMLSISGTGSVVHIYGGVHSTGENAGISIVGKNNTCYIYDGAKLSAKAGHTVHFSNNSSYEGNALYMYGGSLTTETGARTIYIQQPKARVDIYGGTIQMGNISSARAVWMNVSGSQLNIYGGYFQAHAGGDRLLGASQGAVLIEGGDFHAAAGQTLFFESGVTSVTIRKGVLKDTQGNTVLDSEGNTIPTEPRFYGAAGAAVFNCTATNAVVRIEGGLFHGAGGQLVLFSGNTMDITGGTFRNDGGVFLRTGGSSTGRVTVSNVEVQTAGHLTDFRSKAQREVVFENVTATVVNGQALFRFEGGKDQFIVKSGTYTLLGDYYVYYAGGDSSNKGAKIRIEGGTVISHATSKSMFYMQNTGVDLEFVGGTIISKHTNILQMGSSAVASVYIGGDAELISEKASIVYSPLNSTAHVDVTIAGGTLRAAKNIVDWNAGYNEDAEHPLMLTITGGTFKAADGETLESCVKVAQGLVNIYGGQFYSNGAAVIALGGGEVDNGNLLIKDHSTAELNVFGGMFVLEANDSRNVSTDAVLKCGYSTVYGKANVYGGTFVNDRACSAQVVLKGHVHASLNLAGGRFLTTVAGAADYITSVGVSDKAAQNIPGIIGEGALAVNTVRDEAFNILQPYYLFVVGNATYPELSGNSGNVTSATLVPAGNGIVFETTFTATAVDFLKALAAELKGTLTYGTVIAPVDAVLGSSLTVETVGATVVNASNADLTAADGGYVVKATVNGVTDTEQVYCAVGFAKIQVGAKSYYYYTDFDTVSNAASIDSLTPAAE